MKKFTLRLARFLALILIIPILNWILDPFDYFEHPFKIEFDRIGKARTFNVADWTLSELQKIDDYKKKQATVISLGDSRGQSLITGGFKGGWKSRMIDLKHDKLYDISFGGAQLVEMNSLLDQELALCPKVKKVIFVLSVDRLIERPHLENRIESSMFNSKFPNITYLMNPRHIKTFVSASFEKTKSEMNEDQVAERMRIIGADFLKKYKAGTRADFEKYLSEFSAYVKSLKKKRKLKVCVILPPYEPAFFNTLMLDYKDIYSYSIKRMKSLGIPIYNLQKQATQFNYGDPVHGILKEGHVLDLIFNSQNPEKEFD